MVSTLRMKEQIRLQKNFSQTSGYSDHPILLKSQDKFIDSVTRNDGYQFFPLDNK
jgi:hypothetical protein